MTQDFLNINRGLAVLIDPDKFNPNPFLFDSSIVSIIDYFFVGGSGELKNSLKETIEIVKSNTHKPCIIFPGAESQITDNADALLILSLLSLLLLSFL